ncbi:MAG: serine/threonine-protein phosphatase [Bacteroidaceae bacterium]|nr:serine/threonine-protein phosphatase [Bacteroidaceae bacterium]
MNIAISATTHPGLERDNNEDAFAICIDLAHPRWTNENIQTNGSLGPLGAVLMVADGIGGFNAGEVASAIATTTVGNTLTPEAAEKAIHSQEASADLLREAIKRADEAIEQHIQSDFHTVGMGTTIVIAWVQPQHTHIAWCGDSRCYIYTTQDGLRAVTHDHSHVQELVDKGQITAKEALTHPDANIITRALGDVDCSSEPEVTTLPTKAESTLVLCTDGLCGYADDEAILHTASSCAHQADKCCQALLQQALNTGGHDNIAVAVAHLTEKRPNFFQRLFHRT